VLREKKSPAYPWSKGGAPGTLSAVVEQGKKREKSPGRENSKGRRRVGTRKRRKERKRPPSGQKAVFLRKRLTRRHFMTRSERKSDKTCPCEQGGRLTCSGRGKAGREKKASSALFAGEGRGGEEHHLSSCPPVKPRREPR